VDDAVVGAIDAGLLVLLGITHTDTPQLAVTCARKIAADSIGAPVLVVSQFTLYGDPTSGRRPSWQAAAPAAVAEPLVEAVVAELRRLGLPVETGRFGAMMTISSVHDGPFTILLES
jgi:D-tyrosyl-tRNA(Tyr) deacylase